MNNIVITIGKPQQPAVIGSGSRKNIIVIGGVKYEVRKEGKDNDKD